MYNPSIEEGWVSIPLGGVPMERINLAFFYQLGALLRPLTKMKVKAETRTDIWLATIPITEAVRNLLDTYSALTVCHNTGVELIKVIAEMQKWIHQTPSKEWQKANFTVDSKFRKVISKANEFQTVLSADLRKLDAYYVTQKGIYDTSALIARTENVLPIPVLDKIAREVNDEIRESGKCLAFDCATASGFHMMRAIEAVMHDYYVFVCKPASKERLNGWANYISALYALTKDTNAKLSVREDTKKVIALLQLIKDQDRNLIMHPEVILTPDDAHKLFIIAQSAIIAMTDQLPKGKKKKTLSSEGKAK